MTDRILDDLIRFGLVLVPKQDLECLHIVHTVPKKSWKDSASILRYYSMFFWRRVYCTVLCVENVTLSMLQHTKV